MVVVDRLEVALQIVHVAVAEGDAALLATVLEAEVVPHRPGVGPLALGGRSRLEPGGIEDLGRVGDRARLGEDRGERGLELLDAARLEEVEEPAQLSRGVDQGGQPGGLSRGQAEALTPEPRQLLGGRGDEAPVVLVHLQALGEARQLVGRDLCEAEADETGPGEPAVGGHVLLELPELRAEPWTGLRAGRGQEAGDPHPPPELARAELRSPLVGEREDRQHAWRRTRLGARRAGGRGSGGGGRKKRGEADRDRDH